MSQSWSYRNGEFLPSEELSISVQDAGFVLGITVAEQIRTFGGKLFRLAEHLARLRRSLEIVGVSPGLSMERIARDATDLVERNHRLLAKGDDLGLSIFVTPGLYGTFAAVRDSESVLGMHTYPLPFSLWAKKYQIGQWLTVADVVQVPATCWPRELKCRSRMHYYLADQQALAKQPGSRALIVDVDGMVSEASTANVLCYIAGEGIVSPPPERILPGISAAVLEELAAALGIPFVRRDLLVQNVAMADEAFLCSTSPCILPVVKLDGADIGSGSPGPVFTQLLQAWSGHVGTPIAEQAKAFSERGKVG